jgi:DtxR family Mn-dependent transcriptional regulator
MTSSGSSESVEMYLKSLAELGGDRESVPIGRVAERLGVSSVSASEMMKRLGEQGLIKHELYKGVHLTAAGRQQANNVIRRQRLWEYFLVNYLKLDWARAYDLACSLEHATEPEVTDALADFMDHPRHCPHGNPIPDEQGAIIDAHVVRLADVGLGEYGHIVAIVPERGDILSYLSDRELRPGQQVTVLEVAPLEGPLTLLVGEEEVVLGRNLAERVLMEISDGK